MTPPSPATPATAAKGPGAQGPDEPELQEIVVTGMRASLEKSLDIKRDAAVVLDSINADRTGSIPGRRCRRLLGTSARHHHRPHHGR